MTKLLLLALAVSACNTQFTGDPKVPNGPAGCVAVCSAWNMELAGMIQMGEFSDGCICQVRGRPTAETITTLVTAAGPAIAGVAIQMQRQAQQRNR
jgi:hypothetical protein